MAVLLLHILVTDCFYLRLIRIIWFYLFLLSMRLNMFSIDKIQTLRAYLLCAFDDGISVSFMFWIYSFYNYISNSSQLIKNDINKNSKNIFKKNQKPKSIIKFLRKIYTFFFIKIKNHFNPVFMRFNIKKINISCGFFFLVVFRQYILFLGLHLYLYLY